MNYPAYFPIETSYEESGGRALAIAEGSVTVSLKMIDGTTVELVKGDKSATLETNPKSLAVDTTMEVTINLITGMKITAIDGTDQATS